MVNNCTLTSGFKFGVCCFFARLDFLNKLINSNGFTTWRTRRHVREGLDAIVDDAVYKCSVANGHAMWAGRSLCHLTLPSCSEKQKPLLQSLLRLRAPAGPLGPPYSERAESHQLLCQINQMLKHLFAHSSGDSTYQRKLAALIDAVGERFDEDVTEWNMKAPKTSSAKARLAPLFWLAGRGHADALRILLLCQQDCVDPTKSHKRGYTALSLAVGNDEMEAARTILEYGKVGIGLQNIRQETVLWTAASSRSPSLTVQSLLNRFPEAAKLRLIPDKDGRLPLHMAIRHELDPEVLIALAEPDDGEDPAGKAENDKIKKQGKKHGAAEEGEGKMAKNTNRGPEGRTPFMAACHELNVGAVRALLLPDRQPPIDLLKRDAKGRSVLHILAECPRRSSEHDEKVSTMLQMLLHEDLRLRGNLLELQNKAGEHPLATACRTGATVMIDILLDCEPRLLLPHREDIAGALQSTPPLCLASQAGNISVLRAVRGRVGDEIARLAVSDDGMDMCALATAAKAGRPDVVAELLEWSKDGLVDVNRPCAGLGRTPLLHASTGRVAKAVKLLCGSEEVDLTARDSRGCNAVYLSALAGNDFITKILLISAKDRSISVAELVNAANADGVTPLMIAKERGHVKVIKELRRFAGDELQLDVLDNSGRCALTHALMYAVKQMKDGVKQVKPMVAWG